MTELPKINISNPLDELFSTEEERQSSQQERIVTINCDEIDSFQKHPFKVRDNQDMDELIESIQKNGVIMPCIVRPKENGRYEMVSGHRRKHAAIRAGLNSLKRYWLCTQLLFKNNVHFADFAFEAWQFLPTTVRKRKIRTLERYLSKRY